MKKEKLTKKQRAIVWKTILGNEKSPFAKLFEVKKENNHTRSLLETYNKPGEGSLPTKGPYWPITFQSP